MPLELDDDELESVRDVLAFAGGKIDEEKHYALSEKFNSAADALKLDEVSRKDVPEEWRDARPDGGDDRDLPRVYEGSGIRDALDDLRPGDRVLWGDREIPCVVARVVEPGDRVGQSLTASVISSRVRKIQRQRAEAEGVDMEDFFLNPGDVFLNPTTWGRLTGKRFAVIQGPRGGFYAVAEPESGRHYPALYRAVRSFHSTNLGQPGQGAWNYEEDLDGEFEIVESGDAPDELDPEGDLPTYEEIRENRLVSYDGDANEHYVVTETVEEAFDEGLLSAHERAAAEASEAFDEEEAASEWEAVPDAERVSRTPEGHSHSTVTVTEIYRSEYGLKAVLDGPAPWETPDDARPMNEVLKETPWSENHRTFDSDRGAWTVDADELVAVASVLTDYGYSVLDEADRDE